MKANKELDYARLETLLTKLSEFTDTLPEELDEENGFSLLVIANDEMNKVSGVYTLLNENDKRKSLVQCIDKVLSEAALKGADKYPQEWNVLNGIAEYIMRLCAMFPELYDNFQKGVENYKSKKNMSKDNE